MIAVATSVGSGGGEAKNPHYHSKRWVQLHRESKNCSQKNPKACINYAVTKYRQNRTDAFRVAWCESKYDPYATNGVHRGLFQFNYPRTWNTTPYSERGPYSARYNSLAAMWKWSIGHKYEWECQ